MGRSDHAGSRLKWLLALLAASLTVALTISPQRAPVNNLRAAEAQISCLCMLTMNVWPFLPMGGSTEPPIGVNLIYGECGTWLTIPVTATPGDGWEFVEWTGACSGTSPSTEVQCGPLSAVRSCTAVILPLPPEILELRGPDEPVYVGDAVDFTARAEAPEKISCLDFQWDFGDGQSAASTECFEPHEGTVSHVYDSDGEYTVEVTICVSVGGYGNVCNSDSITVTVLAENQPPVVDAGRDQTVHVGTTVHFGGSAEDPDGSIDLDSIHWDFGDGGSDSGSVSTSHSYSGPGEYTVTLTVCDDDGACSKDTLKVTVLSAAGEADLAVFKDNMACAAAARGFSHDYWLEVSNGGPDDAPNVVVEDNLPPGVTFVEDGCGGSREGSVWKWVIGTLAAGEERGCYIRVDVDSDAPTAITNSARVSGPVNDPHPENNEAELTTEVKSVRLDWQYDWPYDWRYGPTALMGRDYIVMLSVDNPLPCGVQVPVQLSPPYFFPREDTSMHYGILDDPAVQPYDGDVVLATAPGQYDGPLVRFRVNNAWQWIEPWDPWRFRDVGLDLGRSVPWLNEIEELTELGLVKPVTGATAVNFLYSLADVALQVGTVIYAERERVYEYIATTGPGSRTLTVQVTVPPEKYAMFGASLLMQFGAGWATQAAWVAGFTGNVLPAAGLALLEVAGIYGQEKLYDLAADPAPDFTEPAEAQPIPMPNHCLPDEEAIRDNADDYSILLGVLQALSDSYIRWEAAEDAGSEEWVALHLDRIETYANEAADIIDGLVPVTEELVSEIPIPAESQIPDIRQSMTDTGLPEMEVCLLDGLGYVPEEIDAIGRAFLAFPDEYFLDFGGLPDMMAVLAAALREFPNSLTRVLPVGALTLGLSAGWNHACYAGPTQPIEEALVGIIENVLAVYRLTPGQGFERWFPGRPEVSTITTINPYDALFVLTPGGATWAQEDPGIPPESVDLVQGWNSVCYTGQTKSADAATAGVAGGFAILYRLGDQVWGRFIPGRPEVSSISQLNQYEAVLMLVTQPSGMTWVFNP